MKLVREQSKISFSERLKVLNLSMLKYRGYWGDTNEVFKIIKDMYHPTCAAHFGFVELSDVTVRTGDCKYKLTQHHCHYDLRIFSFTNCLITFRVRRSRGEIYIVTAICMFVCLSVPHPIPTLLHRPDVMKKHVLRPLR